jgi:hypothetical protein
MRLVRIPAAGLMVLLLAATASAASPDRVAQDDATVVCRWHDPQQALAQMRDGGFTHVRINVVHAPGPRGRGLVACALPATLADYDRAIAAVRSAGLVPQLTLLWSHTTDPAAIARWMGEMARHFAGQVRRFSVLNEPDLTIPAADSCDPETVRQMIVARTLRVVTRRGRVKRYLRHRVRVRRHGRTVKVWRPVFRTRRRRGRGRRRVRAYRWVRASRRVVEEGSEA